LGAAALGDIGEMFPDTDEANRRRDSAEMLRIAHQKVKAVGYRVMNLDCVVSAQRPLLSPHRTTISERIADLLDVEPDRIGLKAKTGEKVGPVGREEVIEARCVLLLTRDE